MTNKKIPIEVSARHVHLSLEDLEILFGVGYQLTVFKKLSQLNEYATKEKVTINYLAPDGKKLGMLEGLRIIGPERKNTQLEITASEARELKANPPIRISGDIEGTPGFEIVGPQGKVFKKEGMLIAQRHLHLSPAEAFAINLKDEELICLEVEGQRRTIFCNIKVRIKEGYKLACHLDTDEGNAAGIQKFGWGKIIKLKS